MIILSVIAASGKLVEFTDVINIAEVGADLTDPNVIRELLCSFYNLKKDKLSLEEHSPFNNTFLFNWERNVDGEVVIVREVICFWKVLK